jgi:hypothetical protein
MESIKKITCGVPFCQKTKGEETSESIAFRMAAIVLGVTAIIVGSLIIRGVIGLRNTSVACGWSLISVGSVLVVSGSSIKYIQYSSSKPTSLASQIVENKPSNIPTHPETVKPKVEIAGVEEEDRVLHTEATPKQQRNEVPPNTLEARRISAIRIVDAKDVGMSWEEVRNAIDTIARKELKGDEGMISPWSYVKEEYFIGGSIEPGPSSPESILLAVSNNTIVGFIITRKSEEEREGEFTYAALPADTGYVAYLAVDSDCKRSGAGTKLMLAAMYKTKQIGKRYLTLEYVSEGLGVDKTRGRAKKEFYNSFAKRFSIPTQEKGNVVISRQWHIHPYYDLRDVDCAALLRDYTNTISGK